MLLALPGLLGPSLLRSRPAAQGWPRSPAPGLLEVEKPPRWDEPARQSLALLRRVTAKASRAARAELATCETRALRAAATTRAHAFRHCATGPLARLNGFGS